MEPQTPTERMIQEYVPGKQVTLAHLIANPGKDLFKKLGLPDAVSAIGILTITPSEASIIACDIATKSGAVEIGFLDRFTGARGAGGDCLLHGADVAAEHQQEFPGAKGSAEQELYVRAFQHDVAQLHPPGDAGQF